jgi:uncharacterized protein
MPLQVNLRHLDAHNLRFEGALPVSELDIEIRDDVIQLAQPLDYRLDVQKLENSLLVQGRLELALKCQCVRCLKTFEHRLQLDPWTCHLPLQGEDAIPVVNDCVDLTPSIREDILLEFPQHPLCERDCGGLRNAPGDTSKVLDGSDLSKTRSPAWNELNKLKF